MITDLIIIGGGAVGLSLADCALRDGLRVTVLDKGEMGREASWAGAGMLTCRPRPKRSPAEFDYHDLKILSCRLHEQWAARLLEETGVDVGYRVCGALELIPAHSHTPAQDDAVLEWIAACNERGVRARIVSADIARHLEPSLTGDFAQAIEFPDEAQIRNPWFIRGLRESIRQKGGEFREGACVADIDVKDGRCLGVILQSGEKIPAPAVAVCAGAWTSQLPALAAAVPGVTKISPVRGQLLCYETNADIARRLLTLGNHYAVPRGDGVLLVGATHDHAGFDKSITSEGTRELEEFAHWLLPELRKNRPVHTWAGLRPGLKGRHPLLGPVQKIHGLYVAAGHYRNGLNLAPVSAELVLATILKRKPKIPVESWLPD